MPIWNPAQFQRENWVKIVQHPASLALDRDYTVSEEISWADWRKLSDEQRLLRLFVMFTTMVVRDGVPVGEAHRALLKIDEYWRAMPKGMARNEKRTPA